MLQYTQTIHYFLFIHILIPMSHIISVYDQFQSIPFHSIHKLQLQIIKSFKAVSTSLTDGSGVCWTAHSRAIYVYLFISIFTSVNSL